MLTDPVHPDHRMRIAYERIKYDVYQTIKDLIYQYTAVNLVLRWEPGKTPGQSEISIPYLGAT